MHSIYINIQNIFTNCSFLWLNKQQNKAIFFLAGGMKESNWMYIKKVYCTILHLLFHVDIPWCYVPLSLSLGGGHAVTLGVGAPAGVTAAFLPRPLLVQLSYLCVYSAYVLNHPLHHCPHIPRLNCVQPIPCFYTFTQHL